jgi:hypothetical protein
MSTYQSMTSAFSSAGAQTRKGFAKLANGGFSTFIKIMILVVTFYVICISITNVAAYAYILRRPDDQQNVTKTWCITLIVLNIILAILALAIHIIVIISFFRKGGQKIAEVVDASEKDGINRGVKMAAQVSAAREAEKAKIQSIEDGNSESTAKATADATFRREYIKTLQEIQAKMGTQQQSVATQSAPVSAEQLFATAQSMGLQIQLPPGYSNIPAGYMG